MVARASGVQSRLVEISTSAAISDLRFAAEHAAHALDDRPQRDDGGDADGDADEEEQQAPPRRARFAHRHAQDEHHRGTALDRSPRVLDDAAVAQDQPRVGHRRQLGVVRHEHERRRRDRVDLAQQIHDVAAVALSRLPVGSSASTIGGSLASARASATRCCSPPDSCDG